MRPISACIVTACLDLIPASHGEFGATPRRRLIEEDVSLSNQRVSLPHHRLSRAPIGSSRRRNDFVERGRVVEGWGDGNAQVAEAHQDAFGLPPHRVAGKRSQFLAMKCLTVMAGRLGPLPAQEVGLAGRGRVPHGQVIGLVNWPVQPIAQQLAGQFGRLVNFHPHL
jgi:hypothetical protein